MFITNYEKIGLVDFGSQTAHLIGRRLRQIGIEAIFIPPANALESISRIKPKGLILSGGPSSVYDAISKFGAN